MEDRPARPAPLQEGDDHGHDDRGTAHQDAGNGRFGGAFRGEDREVEADHADGGEHGEPEPSADAESPQRREPAGTEQGHQQKAGRAVAQSLAPRVRIVAQKAVGGEGGTHEGIGDGHEEGSSQGVRVHGPDARKRTGPV